MVLKRFGVGLLFLGLGAAFAADGTVTLELTSSRDGAQVSPGALIPWSVAASVSPGDNAGLALLSVDLIQDQANPALFDLPPGEPFAEGLGALSARGGISNLTREGAPASTGIPAGSPGKRNLVQIGGALNTFGRAGSLLGTNARFPLGLGQGGPAVLARGAFPAPEQPGIYRFSIQNGVAAVAAEVRSLPLFSRVSKAEVVYGRRSITVTVMGGRETSFVRGDVNADGTVDLTDAVRTLGNLFLGEPRTLECEKSADIDARGTVDISDAISLLEFLFLGGAAPRAPYPACGPETTPTAVPCDSFPRCR